MKRMKSLSKLFRYGPGPSSSHTIAPAIAARSFRSLLKDSSISRIQVVLYGSLALTGHGHKTDLAIINALEPYPCEVIFDTKTRVVHPLSLCFEAFKGEDLVLARHYASLGGGEVTSSDDESVCEKDIYPYRNLEDIKAFMEFHYEGIFLEVLDQLGQMPLPPYIKKQCENNDDYQTVYAKVPGSAAAPTAGFHFTPELFKKLQQNGIQIVDITLNIGLGTFRPVKVQDTKDHVMHSETFDVSPEAANTLNQAKKEHRRIIAVGTTSVRTLESEYALKGTFYPTQDEATSIFIQPGYTYRAVDALITNFHLPKSTLVMLVSAFMGRKWTLHCYEEAIQEKYRFFSFGDAMFIYGNYDYSHNLED